MEMIVLSLKQVQIISASFDPEVIMLAFMLKSNQVMRFLSDTKGQCFTE